jgi:hypothetical protein
LTVLLPAKSRLLPTSRPVLSPRPVMCKNITEVYLEKNSDNVIHT